MSNWQLASAGSDNGLVPNRQQAVIWTSAGLIYWRIYASLGLNELTCLLLDKMAAISQTIFSDAFLWMTSFILWLTMKIVPGGPMLTITIHREIPPDGSFRTTFSCSTAHFPPTSWPSRESVAHHRWRGRTLVAFNVTLLILVLEIPFNF